VWPPGSADTVCPRPPLTLTFDRLTLKLVCESHRWGTFLPNLGTLGLCVLELFAMYATDGQTDKRTDKSNAYCPRPYGRGHNNHLKRNSHIHTHFPTNACKISATHNGRVLKRDPIGPPSNLLAFFLSNPIPVFLHV